MDSIAILNDVAVMVAVPGCPWVQRFPYDA